MTDLTVSTLRLDHYRDVDYFIEKLRATIKFFSNLESQSMEDGESDFIPFI